MSWFRQPLLCQRLFCFEKETILTQVAWVLWWILKTVRAFLNIVLIKINNHIFQTYYRESGDVLTRRQTITITFTEIKLNLLYLIFVKVLDLIMLQFPIVLYVVWCFDIVKNILSYYFKPQRTKINW